MIDNLLREIYWLLRDRFDGEILCDACGKNIGDEQKMTLDADGYHFHETCWDGTA